MMIPRPLRLSPKTKAFLAVALALLLWIPQGISTQTQPVVTGHSTFYNGDSYDPCLASVAGIVRSRVMWFNDQVLVERYPGKGTFIYITESGGLDPTSVNALYSDGTSYNFVDPNGAAWHVDELYWSRSNSISNPVEAVHVRQEGNQQNTSVQAQIVNDRQYVWVVELAAQPIYDQFPGSDPHSYYNFLDLVDTCKFTNNTRTYAGETNHTSGLGPSNGHETGATPHSHEVWNADIYLGQAPAIVLGGLDSNAASYTTSWATSPQASQAAANAPENAAPDTPEVPT
jgi:hypothetical protein